MQLVTVLVVALLVLDCGTNGTAQTIADTPSAPQNLQTQDPASCFDTWPDPEMAIYHLAYFQCRIRLGNYPQIDGNDNSCSWIRDQQTKPTDLTALLKVIRKPRPARGPYETTVQYLTRMATSPAGPQLERRLIIASVLLSKTVFFYDADTAQLIIPDYNLRGNSQYGFPNEYSLIMVSSSHHNGTPFVGENAFGVKRVVHVSSDEQYSLASARNEREFVSPRNSALIIPMPPAIARVEIPNIQIVFVAHQMPPLVLENESASGATIENPEITRISQHAIVTDQPCVAIRDGRTGKNFAIVNASKLTQW